jgi:hypothetical protein
MALGNVAVARVRLIVWCKECQHWVEPDPAEMAARYQRWPAYAGKIHMVRDAAATYSPPLVNALIYRLCSLT